MPIGSSAISANMAELLRNSTEQSWYYGRGKEWTGIVGKTNAKLYENYNYQCGKHRQINRRISHWKKKLIQWKKGRVHK